MEEKGFTAITLKRINKSKVYQYLYKKGQSSKHQIVNDLQMGLSTVSQNLSLLEKEGLIERKGYFESTGGRKAQAIRIVPDFRISIGVGILKDRIHLTAIDLYGNLLCCDTLPVCYSNSDEYYGLAAAKILDFIESSRYGAEKILGVSIATQGIISLDNTTVTYGKIMGNTGMNLIDFSSRLPYPCHLEHDSKAAVCLEMWNHRDLDSAVVILLNRNLGGAVIAGHTIHHGRSMHSGAIEHLCINPDGPLCYCGNRGCLETYCSAGALEQSAQMPAEQFFPLLRSSSQPRLHRIWEDYLNHLAFAIKNLNMVLDAPVIISGYLAPYFTEEDITGLLKRIQSLSPFPFGRENLYLGTHGQYTPAIGAALFFAGEFIESV